MFPLRAASGDLISAWGLNEGGASGGEEDKAGPLTPVGAARLAHGLNPGDGGADLFYFRTPWGGEVLSAGSISFCGSLVKDPVLDRWRTWATAGRFPDGGRHSGRPPAGHRSLCLGTMVHSTDPLTTSTAGCPC